MTAPKRGPLERATRAELARLKIRPAAREMAAAAIVLATRADELPPLPEALTCDCGCDSEVEVPEEFLRVDPLALTKLLAELRMTMIKLTEGLSSGNPLDALAAELGRTSAGGPPMGHPERS